MSPNERPPEIDLPSPEQFLFVIKSFASFLKNHRSQVVTLGLILLTPIGLTSCANSKQRYQPEIKQPPTNKSKLVQRLLYESSYKEAPTIIFKCNDNIGGKVNSRIEGKNDGIATCNHGFQSITSSGKAIESPERCLNTNQVNVIFDPVSKTFIIPICSQ